MKREDLMPFWGKNVKLEFSNGFVLEGKIVKITDDTVFFKTSETISAVSLWNIALIVLKKVNTDGQ